MINEKSDYNLFPHLKNFSEANVKKITAYYEQMFNMFQNRMEVENFFCYQFMIANNDSRVLQIFKSQDRLRYSEYKKWNEWYTISFVDLFEFFRRNKQIK